MLVAIFEMIKGGVATLGPCCAMVLFSVQSCAEYLALHSARYVINYGNWISAKEEM